MCGIVGLFLKDKSLEPKLGELLSEMLVSLSDRGPDSAGIAIYGSGEKKKSKITIQSADPDSDFAGLGKELGEGDRRQGRRDREVDPCRDRGADRPGSKPRATRSSSCAPPSASWAPAKSSRSSRKSACPPTW